MRTFCRVFLLILLISFSAASKEKSVLLSVENPAAIDRKNETIAVPLKDLKRNLRALDIDRLVVLDAKSGATVISQVAEKTLLFQSDFKSHERRRFIVKRAGEKVARPQSLVDGRFVLPREDYAWENDKVAFRMYGPAMAKDVNNGIDVWTKRVGYLIVDKWYSESSAAGKDTYHEDHGEGADFFTVGRSLGAGGSGLWLNGKVCQPGVFSAQKTICNGPVRVVFELTYDNWSIEGNTLTERKRISLDAGQHLNRIEVTFEGRGAHDSLQIACGLVKRSNTTVSTDDNDCWMSLWGPTNSDTVNGFLGTGVVLLPTSRVRFTEDKDHYLIIGRTKAGKRFTYYSGAGWTRRGDLTTEDDWKTYLDTFARRLQAPLRVSVMPR
jgi:pectinesterase